MVCKSIVEFLLWNDCSAHGKCAFCWQQAKHEASKFLDNENKLESIECVKNFLKDNFVKLDTGENNKFTGSHILLVGGEIFDIENAEVIKNFKNLINYIIQLMNNNEIELLYINTNLLYKDLSTLEYLLNKIDSSSLWERLRFTTSWDLVGRFVDKESEDLFFFNLNYIKGKYSKVHIVVNSILTKQFCETLIKTPDFIKDFQEKYKVQVNVIPYIVLREWMAPTRNQVIKALLAIDSSIPGYTRAYIENFSLPQPKLLYEYNSEDKALIYCSSDLDSCGHSENFKNYCSDADRCYICDLQHVLDKISG